MASDGAVRDGGALGANGRDDDDDVARENHHHHHHHRRRHHLDRHRRGDERRRDQAAEVELQLKQVELAERLKADETAAKEAEEAEGCVLVSHRSPYDRVRVVNADP